MTAANHAFTVFSLFAFTSASVPLTWHLTEASSWGAGTCLFIFWAGLSSLVSFVNSIVWDGNIVNWTPVWCDICEFCFVFPLVRLSLLLRRIGIYFGSTALCSYEGYDRDGCWDSRFGLGHAEEDFLHG